MRIWHDYAKCRMIFAFLVQVRVWLIVIGEETHRKWRWFFTFVVTTRPSDEAISTITAKQYIFQFFLHEGKVQNVVARFALQTFVTALIGFLPFLDTDYIFLSRTGHSRTTEITKNILKWFLSLFKFMNPLVKPQGKGICLFYSGKIAQKKRGRATASRICQENEKSFCASKVYPNTMYLNNTRSL